MLPQDQRTVSSAKEVQQLQGWPSHLAPYGNRLLLALRIRCGQRKQKTSVRPDKQLAPQGQRATTTLWMHVLTFRPTLQVWTLHEAHQRLDAVAANQQQRKLEAQM
jgi:hypothetical protein